MSEYLVMVIAAGICGLYAYISVRISAAVQPLRLRLVQRINALVENPNLPDRMKGELETLGDSLFSKRIAWLIVGAYPVGVYHSFTRRSRAEARKVLPARAESEVSSVIALGMFCIVASSPLALLIFAVELLILILVFAPLGAASRATLDLLFSKSRDDMHNGGANPSSC